MNQEAICPPPSAGCRGSGRSSGSCCSNGCLHNSPSTARTQNDTAPAPTASLFSNRLKYLSEIHVCWICFGSFLWSVWVLIVHCYPPLALSSLSVPTLLSALPPPGRLAPVLSSSSLLLPATALTVWLRVKAGAFCGSVTNLPGKTETICSGLDLRENQGVNTSV